MRPSCAIAKSEILEKRRDHRYNHTTFYRNSDQVGPDVAERKVGIIRVSLSKLALIFPNFGSLTAAHYFGSVPGSGNPQAHY
jgi:hypothetical protein